MASHLIVQEIINDIIAIDPDLKNIKSELEKLVQELIANKPQTPFTKEFKESLKAQIIGAINEQKILYEEKKRDRNWMFHSIKFWMVGVSSLATCLLVFALFQYFDGIQQPNTQITYMGETKDKGIQTPEADEIAQIQPAMRSLTMSEETGGGASNRADNVIMLAIPEEATESFGWSDPFEGYAAKSTTIPVEEMTNADMAIAETAIVESATTAPSPTFCETSKQFLIANNITENATKTFVYNNQIYKATIDFSNNSININNIGTQDDSKDQTELSDLNLFFDDNNFLIKVDYAPAIIEESDTFIEYYFSRNGQQEWITARIDKATNIIFSIENICIY